MSASQQTTNYNLPKFAGADKPAWLVDFNGAMDLIDSSIKTIEDILTTAQGSIESQGNEISTLENDLQNAIDDLTTAQGNISTLSGNISTLENELSNLSEDVEQNTSDILLKAPLSSPNLTTPNVTGGLNLDSVGMLLKEFSGAVSVATLTWTDLVVVPFGLTLIQTVVGNFYDSNYSSVALILRRSEADSGVIVSKQVGTTYKTDIQLSAGKIQAQQTTGGNNIITYRYFTIG